MSEIWSRIANWIESVAKPWQVLLVVAIGSGALLTDTFGAASRFQVVDSVQQHRILFVIVFLLCASLLLLNALVSFWRFILAHSVRIYSNYSASKLKVSLEGRLILSYIYQQEPDWVELIDSHPQVRELRREKLVKQSTIWGTSESSNFRLTDRGRVILLHTGPTAFDDVPERDRIEFLREVTGSMIVVNERRNWSA